MTSREWILITILTWIFSSAPVISYSQAQTLDKRGFDPDDPPETTIPIAPYLTFGAQLELEYMLQRNLDLDDENDEDLSLIEPGVTLAFSFDPNRHIQAFLAAKFAGEFMFENDNKIEDKAVLEIEQAYIMFRDLLDDRISFQFGRQRFEDERQWLFDEELDAVRLIYKISYISLEFSVSRKDLADRDLLNDDEEEKINNYLFYALYQHEDVVTDIETIAAAYLFYRDDKTEEDSSPFFMGIYAESDLTDSLAAWLQLAHVRGSEGSEDISGYGLEIGGTYEFDIKLEPSITLGYAFGTGDGDTEDGTDKSFRQTGLQNNEGGFNGVPDFKYYGEFLDPELSNLSIFTAGAGINFNEESSLDLVYHYYYQHKAQDSLRDSEIEAEPNGISKDIGNAIDLVVGYEGTNGIEAALRLGYFIPGDAFETDSADGFSAVLELQYEFR